MAMNSVNTNLGAMIALQSLNRTTDGLDATQKRISTGFRVADAKDDGAAFAVAQTVRADISGLTSANEQLGGVKGILDTTMAAMKRVSDAMADIREVLVKLSDSNVNGDTRGQYEAQFASLVGIVNRNLADATYNGRSLIGTDAADATARDVTTVRNEAGTTVAVGAVAANALTFTAVVGTGAAPAIITASVPTAADPAVPLDADAAREMLSGTPAAPLKSFASVQTAINDAMNRLGNDAKYIDAQISYNKEKLDSIEGGLGALIDADLAKESARLQALQIRQQLGTQSLSIANQAPQSLLSLFGGR